MKSTKPHLQNANAMLRLKAKMVIDSKVICGTAKSSNTYKNGTNNYVEP